METRSRRNVLFLRKVGKTWKIDFTKYPHIRRELVIRLHCHKMAKYFTSYLGVNEFKIQVGWIDDDFVLDKLTVLGTYFI